MNFKRIQWIFLIAFLVFDVVIASPLLVQNRFTIANSSQSHQVTVMKEMRNDAISCDPLSSKQGTGYYLSGSRAGDTSSFARQANSKLRNQSLHFNSDELSSELETPVKIDSKHPSKRLNRFVRNEHSIIYGNQYRYSPSLSDKSTVVYTQVLKGRPLYNSDGQLRFHVNADHEVTSYTQTYLTNWQVLRPQAPTISQQHAVTWLYKHNMIPNNSQVRWANLAYTKLATTTTKSQAVYLPTWVVEIKVKNTGTVERLYVNAFNSTVMKDSPTNINTNTLNN